jgi:hypothetical protein
MNHDPVRFCFECRKLKPTRKFRSLSREAGNARRVCAECFDELERMRVNRLAQANTH